MLLVAVFSTPMLGLAPTVVYIQFLVDRTQFIFVLFDFSPVSYHSVSRAYLFICGLVDAQSAD
jgi:hypothetical protein